MPFKAKSIRIQLFARALQLAWDKKGTLHLNTHDTNDYTITVQWQTKYSVFVQQKHSVFPLGLMFVFICYSNTWCWLYRPFVLISFSLCYCLQWSLPFEIKQQNQFKYQRSPTECGVSRWLWPWILDNKEALAHKGLLRHGNIYIYIYLFIYMSIQLNVLL
jgi:hypothetical protein